MKPSTSLHTGRVLRIAILVTQNGHATKLCPFFNKCDGMLLVDLQNGSRKYYANEQHASQPLCDLILTSGADRVICGFIGEREKQALCSAGIDVRLGSCSCAPDELIAESSDLPRA